MKENNKNFIKVSVVIAISLAFIMPGTTAFDSIDKQNELPSPRSQDSYDPTESLSYSFLFPKPSFKETKLHDSDYTKIDMSGAMTMGMQVGAPALPVNSVQLLLPPKKQISSINVIGESIEINTESMNLMQKPLAPYQKPIPIGDKVPKKIDFDATIYASNERFPQKIFNDYNVGYCCGYPIVSVTLNPVQYVPTEGELFYYPEMTIDIELEDTGYIDRFYRNDKEDAEWVKTLVDNPDIIECYKNMRLQRTEYPGGLCDPSDNYDYVIITTTQNGLDHWETSPDIPYNWTSLMDKHEADDGLSCTLVTVEEIYEETAYHNPDPLFDDDPARIREFCKDAYQDWGTSYIFIGGDDEWIPARHMWGIEPRVDSDIY